MSKLVAVVGCKLAFKNPTASGKIVITTSTSYKATSGGNKVYADKIEFTIAEYKVDSFVQDPGTVSGSISGTTSKATASGDALVLEGDESEQITIRGKVGSSTVSASDIVYVKSAGQNVLKAT